MTDQKSFKQRIRARMEKTGESYSTARRQLIAKAEVETRRKRTPRSIAPTRTSDDALREATGHPRGYWFDLLDKWGARHKKHPEIARWLSVEHGVDGWWAQHLTVAYEQARGMRAPGQRPDGTYGVSASKTVGVPVESLFDAFLDESTRHRWLGDRHIEMMTVKPAKTLTARWDAGPTRLAIGFTSKGDAKSQVALAHERLADAQQADEFKTFWRDRLSLLKKLLEDV